MGHGAFQAGQKRRCGGLPLGPGPGRCRRPLHLLAEHRRGARVRRLLAGAVLGWLPARWVSASARFSTPLLRLCRCCVLVLATSGALVVLPGISDADADGLLSYLQGG